jgi:hypothetical protein
LGYQGYQQNWEWSLGKWRNDGQQQHNASSTTTYCTGG